MKYFIRAVAWSVVLAVPCAALAVAGGPTLTAQIGPSSVAVNAEFTVNIAIDAKTYQVSAATVQLTFPSDKVQILSLTRGSFFTQDLGTADLQAGTATFSAGKNPASGGTGTAFVATFRAKAAGTVNIGFGSGTAVAATGQTGNVTDTLTGDSITVSGTQATGTPAPTAGATPTNYPSRTPVPSVVVTPRPSTAAGQAGTVSTGPMETTILAVLAAAIVALAYVGYTDTESFRRHEAGSIAGQEQGKSSDFKS